jgi:demethylmenaquinone methyltransferase / 2-methoxy-6-polyprenyl-1,4-benzoquinol methylase
MAEVLDRRYRVAHTKRMIRLAWLKVKQSLPVVPRHGTAGCLGTAGEVPYVVFRTHNRLQALGKHNVQSLFDSIAPRYDFLNHLLSCGADVYWRRRTVEHLRDVHPRRILDVATGTGDLAIAALRLSPESVIGVDIAGEMLSLGQAKVKRRGYDHLVTLRSGAAENLDFPSASFDAAMVAFGARNFDHLEGGLREMHRVLRPGGKIVVLEFSRPRQNLFRQLYFFYFQTVLPFVGRIISKNKEAYRYLPETAMRFPEGKEFQAILERVGFSGTKEERLTFGIVSIYDGMKGEQ